MSGWTCRSTDGKAADKIVPPRLRIPWWKGLGADSEEKHEPVSDIDIALVDSLKALDPERPIKRSGHLSFYEYTPLATLGPTLEIALGRPQRVSHAAPLPDISRVVMVSGL